MKLYIARDKDDSLYLYDNVPENCSGGFLPRTGYNCMSLSDDLFPEITFKNSPQEVKLKLV